MQWVEARVVEFVSRFFKAFFEYFAFKQLVDFLLVCFVLNYKIVLNRIRYG